MRNKILLIATVLVFLAICQDAVAITRTYCIIPKTPTQVIYEVAAKNNFYKTTFLIKLAEAESGLGVTPEVLDVNDKYSRGLYHMQYGFWSENCIPLFGEEEDIFSNQQQVECVINVVEKKGIDYVESPGGWFNSCNRIDCRKLLNK